MRKDLLFSLFAFVILGCTSIASAASIDLSSYAPSNAGSPVLQEMGRTARIAADTLPTPDLNAAQQLNQQYEAARANKCSQLLKGDTPQVLSAGYCYTSKFFGWLIALSSLFAAALIVWGGIKYITSGGDPKGTEEARKIIWGAVLGFIIAVMAFAISTYTGELASQVIAEQQTNSQVQNN